MLRYLFLCTAVLGWLLSDEGSLRAQETGPVVSQTGARPLGVVADKTLIDDVDSQQMRFEKFSKLLTGTKLVGHFTIDGKPLDELKQETYLISSVEKLEEGDKWVVNAQIKYGEYDLTVPVPLDVKWAGSTPVMVLDNIAIPTLGTFSARVLFHGDKYTGTWQHDQVGGHLFGRLEFAEK